MLRKNSSLVLAFVIGTFAFATPVHAQEVNIPSSFTINGLTPDSPLAADNPQDAPLVTLIQFSPTAPTFVIPNSDQNSDYNLPLPTPIPTIAPQETPTPTPTTASVTATPTPDPTIIPTPSGGLNASVLFNMVQTYRTSQGLPDFQTDPRACTVAQARAPEVDAEIESGTMHSGLKAMNLPYWNTENIISMRTETEAFNWWINDPIHHDAIVGDYKYSCLACSGNACAEEFTNFQPK